MVLPANKVPPAPKAPKVLLAQLDLLVLQAWQAQQVQLGQQEPLVPKERMAQPVPQDPKAHLVLQAHLAVMGQLVLKDHRELRGRLVPLLWFLDRWGLPAHKDPLAQTVPKVLLGPKDQQAHKELLGRQGRRR